MPIHGYVRCCQHCGQHLPPLGEPCLCLRNGYEAKIAVHPKLLRAWRRGLEACKLHYLSDKHATEMQREITEVLGDINPFV